jgi:DNA polymerase III subunit gamma/tau
VIVSNEAGQATLREQSLVARNEREKAAEADPRVKEVLARFPGAKVVEVRRLAAELPESDVSEQGLGDDGFVGEGPGDSDDDF